MLRPIRFVLALLLWAPIIGVMIGYAGVIHPLGDSFAVFRPYFLTGLVILSGLLILVGGKTRGLAGLVIALVCWFETLPPSLRHEGAGQDFSVYQKNLLYLTVDTRRLEADIRAENADVVTLQELHARNQGLLENLVDVYPYQHRCPYLNEGSLAVLSKWPTDGTLLPCRDDSGLAAMLVDTGRHKIWVASVHLRWPWPYPQSAQLRQIEEQLTPLVEPAVVAGDFNMVHWSYGLKHLARTANLRLAGAAGKTFEFGDLPISLAIDHVFMPDGAFGGTSNTRPRFGSDHLGVISRFVLP